MSSSVILERLTTLHPKQMDLDLTRITRLLNDLGNPQNKVAPVIHIAGTNGKGSTLTFLRSILEAHGKRVHSFTSPHLVHFHERIRLASTNGDSKFIEEDVLCEIMRECEKVNKGKPITVFEVITVIAFMAFSEIKADYLLLETGLGGRLDATNVIDKPLAVILTSISKDHQAFLGDELEKIAYEKASIIKDDCLCVSADQDEQVQVVISNYAKRKNVEVKFANQDFQTYEQQGRLIYQDEQRLYDLSLPKMIGYHQIENGSLAISCIVNIANNNDNLKLYPNKISKGIQDAFWPARMQHVPGELLEIPSDCDIEIWLDGGHNEGASKVVAQSLSMLDEKQSKPCYMICAMKRTKFAKDFFTQFLGVIHKIIAIPLSGDDKCHSADELADWALEVGINAHGNSDFNSALLEIIEIYNTDNKPLRLIICGSLYLAGEVSEIMEKKAEKLQKT